MSSLRIETLRLCWLEAFVDVAESENISETARNLGMDQSTVSRYLQSLAAWLGRELVQPGKVKDPDNPAVSIGVTDEGQRFYEMAKKIIATVQNFRTEESKSREIILKMKHIVDKLKSDLNRKYPSETVQRVKENIDQFDEILSIIDQDVPWEQLEAIYRPMKTFYCNYEREKELEVRRGRVKRVRRT